MFQLVQKIRRAAQSRAEGRRERGAALVEAAIAIPLLLLVIMGSVEFGFAWEAKSASVSGMRSGVLRAAAIGDKPHTDMSILQSVVGEIGADKTDQIEWVMIFKADASMTEDARIADCQATGTDCVIYFGGTGSILDQVATTTDAQTVKDDNFDDGLGAVVAGSYQCDVSKLDKNWCAGKRTDGDQDTEFGLAVRYQHEWFTGIFPFNPPVFEDATITSTFLHEGATSITPVNNVPTNIGNVFDSGGFSSLANGGLVPPGFTLNGGAVDPAVHLDSNPPGQPIEFFGRFGSDTLNLTVPTTAPHTEVCVSFTLYILGSWDVSGGYKDTFSFDVNTADGVKEIDDQVYARGDTLGDLGYPGGGYQDQGRTVQVGETCVPHTGDSVDLVFSAIMTNTNLDNEAWAIDDLSIRVVN